jgi:transglutaminase-like putative cysteine protease
MSMSVKRALSTQNLRFLLFTLAVILAIHSPNIPLWVTLTSIGFGIWRYLLERFKWPMPNTWTLVAINLLIGLSLLITFRHQFGRDASLSLLIVMCSLKLLETKTLRDYKLVIIIAYFLVGILFLFNQSITTFLLSIPPLVLLTATLINISLKEPKQYLFLLSLSGKMLLQAVPVMLILFVLFPRIPGPLWGIPQDANSGMTGLGDSLQFGNISRLTKSSAIAFRVKFKEAVPNNQNLYWRGPVLWHQYKREWLMPSKQIGMQQETLEVQGPSIAYTITLEPHNRLWLLMLDMPTSIPKIGKLTHDYSAISNDPIRTRVRYDAVSNINYQLGTNLGERERIMSLQITEGENPRTLQLAKSWQPLSPTEKINQALSMFRNEPFIYTLSPPILGDNPLDDFLFNTRKGFCEHYATSFVYLMRLAGVPARIVTGYQGGEFNPNGGYLIVRQSDAHAWTEVWLENQGWVRVDPTAAVSPERIEQGISEALGDYDLLPIFARHDYPLLRKAFLNFDSINNGWNQWVLGYNDEKQFDFLSNLTGKNVTLQDMIIWMMSAIVLVMCITSYFLFKKANLMRNQSQKIYHQYLAKLSKIQLKPYPHEGALDFAIRSAIVLPALRDEIMQIANHYNTLQYDTFEKSPDKKMLILQALQNRVNAFNVNVKDKAPT